MLAGLDPQFMMLPENFIGASRTFIAPVREFSPGLYSDFDEHRLCRFSIDHDLERFQ
jgi:hypothetical protein